MFNIIVRNFAMWAVIMLTLAFILKAPLAANIYAIVIFAIVSALYLISYVIVDAVGSILDACNRKPVIWRPVTDINSIPYTVFYIVVLPLLLLYIVFAPYRVQ